MDLLEMNPLAKYLASFTSENHLWLPFIFSIILHSILCLSVSVPVIIYLDHKLGADIQMRIGSNRVGPHGVLQNLANLIKTLFKQDNIPQLANISLFRWGPILAIVLVFVGLAPIPFAKSWVLSDIESGAIFVVAILGIIQLILFLTGYVSGSQWAFLGAFRVIVMLASYIVPVVLALLPVILIVGSANFQEIVEAQGGFPWQWLALSYPTSVLALFVMYLGLFIWQERSPFDVTIANKELANGLLTEFSGLRKGFIIYLRYTQFLLSCVFIVTLFLGGWQVPLDLTALGRAAMIVQCFVFLTKVFCLVLFGIWIRWSLPRMRLDQVISFSWKVLVPVALFSSLLTALWLVLMHGKGLGNML